MHTYLGTSFFYQSYASIFVGCIQLKIHKYITGNQLFWGGIDTIIDKMLTTISAYVISRNRYRIKSDKDGENIANIYCVYYKRELDSYNKPKRFLYCLQNIHRRVNVSKLKKKNILY